MHKAVKTTVLRDHLADTLEEVQKTDYILVTKRGRPISALVNIDFFEDLLALAGTEYVESIKEARADHEAGRMLSHAELFGEL
jgi:prevent-host-death family protein